MVEGMAHVKICKCDPKITFSYLFIGYAFAKYSRMKYDEIFSEASISSKAQKAPTPGSRYQQYKLSGNADMQQTALDFLNCMC